MFFVLISFPVFLFQFLFCYILERKDKKWFKRDIIVFISFLILFVSISFPVAGPRSAIGRAPDS